MLFSFLFSKLWSGSNSYDPTVYVGSWWEAGGVLGRLTLDDGHGMEERAIDFLTRK